MTFKRKTNLPWLLFLVFVFTIPLSQFVSSRLIVGLLAFPFLLNARSNWFISLFKNTWDIVLYSVILMVGLIYSTDWMTGLNVIETNLSFLAIPIVISYLPTFTGNRMKEIFKAFLFGLNLASAICLSVAVYRYSQSSHFQVFFFEEFTAVINSHPTYFAYYIIFAITIELFLLYYNEDRHYLLLRYLTILFLFLILILTGGQTAFISLLFVFSFFILKYLTEEKSRTKSIVVGIVISMLCCMFLVTFLESTNRTAILNDTWERSVLWESAITAIPNLLIGVGTGDYKMVLNEYYMSHNLTQFASESYNSHNQVIQLLFSNGILGVFGFACMIARPLYLAVRNKNILAILCLFPFLIYGMTEVFLGRYQGVVFFALLHQIFIAEMNHQKSSLQDPIDINKNLNVKPI